MKELILLFAVGAVFFAGYIVVKKMEEFFSEDEEDADEKP